MTLQCRQGAESKEKAMEPAVSTTHFEETRYLSHAEFAQLFLERGIAAVLFDYEDGQPDGRISNVRLQCPDGEESEKAVPAALRLALEQRLADNFLCHHKGKYLGCGLQQFEWELTTT
jgi:hypothetical protein